MVKPVALVAIALLSIAASVSSASANGRSDCTTQPRSKWKTRADAVAVATAAGHKVLGTKFEGTCIELYAITKNGRKAELFYNPVTLKLLQTIYK